MVTIRKKFHELGNCHNKVSIAAIVTREALTHKDIENLSLPEIKKIIDKAVVNLNKIEEFIASADEAVGSMKPFIYETMGADTEILLK